VTYGFVEFASKAGRRRTHSFHKKRHTEEIDFFLINKNVDSALRNPSLSGRQGYKDVLAYFVDESIVYTELSRKPKTYLTRSIDAEFTARLSK